jgi:PAS domain S-box-containing protein
MGVPLLIDNNMIGIAAIRDYVDADSFTPEDVEFLVSVSDQIAVAIERKRAEEALQLAHEELEHRVLERTKELEEANIKLRKEIQEREKAQEVLRLSEEKFSKAFQSSPTLMSISTLEDGTFIDVNDSFLKAHGFRREEVMGRTSIELGIISSEDRNTLSNKIEKGPFHRLELDLYTKTGGRIHGSFSADVINIEGRSCLLAAVDDISEQKKAENALKESEERYRAIFENSPVGISLTSKEGRFVTVNQAIADMSGFTIDELLKLPLSALYQDPEKRKPLLEAIKRDGMVFNYPVQFKRKDGFVSDTLLTMTKVPQTGGEEVYQSICIDITSQIKAEREKKELEARLNQVRQMDAIATLAGGVAHQFNNALSTIIGNLELLNMDIPGDEKTHRYIGAMKDSVYRMAHLNDQLLAYARGGKYRPEIIGLNDFIRDTLPLIKHTIQPFVYLETDLPSNIMGVKADLTQIQMILSAILSNASEAIEKKGRILISCRNETITGDNGALTSEIKPGTYVHLTVEDDGKGMNEKTKSRIFEPFFSTKLHGRGLGMAAVYGIIKNHDGYIMVDSEEGKGTKVHVYLPVLEVQQKKERDSDQSEGFGKESGTVLLIEDEENVMEVNHAMLERLGYRVLKAISGKQAVDIIKTYDEHIDLAILDIILPDMDGKTIYHIMKEFRPDMNVILCSGYSCDGPAQEILNAGAQLFIQKPFSMRGLAEKVKEVLKK